MTEDHAIADLIDVLRTLERTYLREVIAGSPKASATRASLDLAFRLLARQVPKSAQAVGHFLEAVQIAHHLDPGFGCEDEPGCCADLLTIAVAALRALQTSRRREAVSMLQERGFAV